MRLKMTIVGLVATVLTCLNPGLSFAAGESGHSDLPRLLAAIFGLNLNTATYLADANQSVDKVLFSAATRSGRASEKLHFGRVKTQSDLDEADLQKILENNGNRPFLS